jgi:hypothetical protein
MKKTPAQTGGSTEKKPAANLYIYDCGSAVACLLLSRDPNPENRNPIP